MVTGVLGSGVVYETLARNHWTGGDRAAIRSGNGRGCLRVKPCGRGVARLCGAEWVDAGGEAADVIPPGSRVGALFDWAIVFGSVTSSHVILPDQGSASGHQAIVAVLEIKPRTRLRPTASEGTGISTGAESIDIVCDIIVRDTVPYWTVVAVGTVACVVLSWLRVGALSQGADGSGQGVEVSGGSRRTPSHRAVIASGKPRDIILSRFCIGARCEGTLVGEKIGSGLVKISHGRVRASGMRTPAGACTEGVIGTGVYVWMGACTESIWCAV